MVRVVKTKVEIEGEIHEETVVVDGDEPKAWGKGEELTVVGTSPNRVDGAAKVTGAARYTYDMHPPGLLEAAVLRCPHPHARIISIDTSEAEKLPGVRAVLSLNNAPDTGWYGKNGKLFDSELRFVGEEVAVVAADDADIARDALKLIKVEYQTLPFVLDVEQAVLPGAVQVLPVGNVIKSELDQPGELYKRGDVVEGFKHADVIVERTYRTSTQLHNSFETHGCVATWLDDELTLWESTQNIFGVRSTVAGRLGMPHSKVHVISEFMGGGFGSKGQTMKHSVIAALLSKASGRPVKLMMDRREENLLTGNRGESVQKLKIGAKKDGTLVAIDLHILNNIGAYGNWAAAVAGPAKELYKCANVRTHTLGVRTNLGPQAAFRAPGFTEGTVSLEMAMEELAEKLGMDVVEIRLKNYADHDQTSNSKYTAKNLKECYERAVKQLDLPKDKLPKPGTAESKSEPKGDWKRGMGMASQIWSGGGGPPAHATVRLNSDGTVEVFSGTQDIGTGTKTALSQIAAEELGVRLEDVRFRLGDTQKGNYAPASWGSMTVPSVGPAVRMAAADAKQQLLDIASHFLEVPAKNLVVRDSKITIEGRKESEHSIKDILKEIGDYMINGKGYRGPNPTQPLRTWGAQVADVEVNVKTGEVRVLRMSAIHDIGRVLNPKGLSSQFYGGILQGIGMGVFEERIVDEGSGIVLNPNLQDYKVPTIADVPEMLVGAIDLPDTAANHVGSKGAGEPPMIPAPAAIANAVANAIGVRITHLPITRHRVLEALQEASSGGQAGNGRGKDSE